MADEAPSAHSTRWLETSRGILRYAELAPLLAERVLRLQERIEGDQKDFQPLARIWMQRLAVPPAEPAIQ